MRREHPALLSRYVSDGAAGMWRRLGSILGSTAKTAE